MTQSCVCPCHEDDDPGICWTCNPPTADKKFETAQAQAAVAPGRLEQAFIGYKHAFVTLGRSPEDACKLALAHMRGRLEKLEAKHVLKKPIEGKQRLCARVIKPTRKALEIEHEVLLHDLEILDDLQDKEDTMRQRLKDIQFLLGGGEQR